MHADNDTRSDVAPDERVALAVEVFAMLADATRIRILLALRDGERSVGDVSDVVGKAPAAVSQHLAKLRLARLVTTRHEGTRVFYRRTDDHALQLVLDAMHQGEHSVGAVPPHAQRDAHA